MASYSNILVWEIPWTEESGRQQSMGFQKSDMAERLTLSFLNYTQCLRQNNDFQSVCSLRTCNYVAFHGERGFPDRITDFEFKNIEMILDYLGGSNRIIECLKSRELSNVGINEIQQRS